MRNPTRRYGNPTEMAYYAMSYGPGRIGVKALAKTLRRSERSVKDWLTGAKRVPWWVPEIMRLKELEHWDKVYQMTGRRLAPRLGSVAGTGEVIDAGLRFRPLEQLPVAEMAASDEMMKRYK